MSSPCFCIKQGDNPFTALESSSVRGFFCFPSLNSTTNHGIPIMKRAESRCACWVPEDHLRLLCLHLLRHGASRPLWLCGCWGSARVDGTRADFDWEYFLSGNRRRTDYVACTLLLAHRLLGARLDGTPVKGRAEQLPSWLVPTRPASVGNMALARRRVDREPTFAARRGY